MMDEAIRDRFKAQASEAKARFTAAFDSDSVSAIDDAVDALYDYTQALRLQETYETLIIYNDAIETPVED